MSKQPTFTILLFTSILGGSYLCAAPPTANERAFFETKIRPVLVKHCYECHATDADEVGGKLLLDSRVAVLRGGESGPALVPGDPAASLLLQAMKHSGDLAMPPEEPLSPTVISDFERWIRRGAVDPRSHTTVLRGAKETEKNALWSFQPRSNPPLPEVKDESWPRDPLDRFVLARIESAKLLPTEDADARTLVRRIYQDLTGLPPTFRQVEEFEAQFAKSPTQTLERLVDRLLGLPQFGERWGQHWLDIARYGESNGDDGLGRNPTFPHAWRYRDYVIDALNADVPYDKFLTEQIAGDLLPANSAEERNRQLIATGFLAIGSKPAAAMNKNFLMDVVDDQINVIGTAALGLSIACARCHDHKHDPIPTRDYYALAGIFRSTETLYGRAGNEKLTAPPTDLIELSSQWNEKVSAKEAKDLPLRFPDTYRDALKSLGPSLHAKLNAPHQAITADASVKYSSQNFAQVKESSLRGELTASGESYSVSFWFRNDMQNAARPITAYLFSRAKWGEKSLPGDHLGIGGTHDKSRTGKLFVFNGNDKKQSIAGETVIRPGTWNHIVLAREQDHVRLTLNGNVEIDADLPATFGQSREFSLATRSDGFAPLTGFVSDFATFERALPLSESAKLFAATGRPQPPRKLGLAMGVRERSKPADCKVHINGDGGKLGPLVPRGFLTAYQSMTSTGAPSIPPGQSGRLELARWITQPDHPQTARVMVNRIWLHLFGQAIVATPDDFGVYGARPSHPQLLDHLANRFVNDDWSVKKLIRAIVLSRTYQLDSRCSADLAQADLDNELFARHLRRRLDAESLRDSMLHASGQLERSPGLGSAIQKTVALINWPPGEASNLHRPSRHRSIYLCRLRHSPPPELAAFDFPDAVAPASQRSDTTLPTQSLYLLNSQFVVEQAESLADDILGMEGWDDTERIADIFRRVLQREPSSAETSTVLALLKSTKQALAASMPQVENLEQRSWASFCQAMLTTNEFRFID